MFMLLFSLVPSFSNLIYNLQISNWLTAQASKFPQLAKIVDIGQTLEGRTQRTIIVSVE